MLYNQYKCLQQYVDGVAQDVYKKGDLVKTDDFNSLEDCEKNISPHPPTPSKGCFAWVNTTDNKIKYWVDEKEYETTVSPVCIGKPNISLRFQSPKANNFIETTYLDITQIDTSAMTTMDGMFSFHDALTSINLSNINSSQVTDLSFMFYNCEKLTSLNLSSFDTSKCTTCGDMFLNCKSLTSLDLSNWNTSSLTDVRSMFHNCKSLVSLVLSNFDMSKVTYYTDMFYNCDSLNYIKCKQAFKDWCMDNRKTISLPYSMAFGSGTWEIVG